MHTVFVHTPIHTYTHTSADKCSITVCGFLCILWKPNFAKIKKQINTKINPLRIKKSIKYIKISGRQWPDSRLEHPLPVLLPYLYPIYPVFTQLSYQNKKII